MRLTIVADDYGYSPAYDAGILEAVKAQAVDAVGAMVLREPDPGPLLAASAARAVRVGLHLEPPALASPNEQLAEFGCIFGVLPAFLDGHHHCHSADGVSEQVTALARRLELPVRSVASAHRRFLRERGVNTADRLVGRLDEEEDALPEEIAAWLEADRPARTEADGLTEWMVHPGHPDPDSGSSYDAGRGEDLALLLDLGDRAAWRVRGVVRVSPGS